MSLGYNYIAREHLFELFDQVGQHYESEGTARLSDHQGINCSVDVALTLSNDPTKAVHLKGYSNFSIYGTDMHVRARIVDADKIARVVGGVLVDIDDVPTLQDLPDFKERFTICVRDAKELVDLLDNNIAQAS